MSVAAAQAGPAKGATKNSMRSRGQLIVEALELWGEMEADWWCGVSRSSNINPDREWKTVADSSNTAGMNMQDLPSFGYSAAQIQSLVNLVDISRPDPQGLAMIPLNIPFYSSNLGQQQQPIASGTFNDIQDHRRTMLIWPLAGSNICVQVIATDLVRFPYSWTWPTSMRLEIWEAGLGTLDIQSTICKSNAPMAQIKCTPGRVRPEFEELVGSLRRVGGFAVAQHDIYDEGRRLGLLFAPLGNVLLCAVLPSSRIEELRNLRRQSRNGATCSCKEPVEKNQEDTFAAKDAISPHQRRRQPQAYDDATQQPQPP